jgi:hypothetical protein
MMTPRNENMERVVEEEEAVGQAESGEHTEEAKQI